MMVRLEVVAILRDLGPMAAVVENQLVARLRIVEQPFHAIENAIGRCPVIKTRPDRFRRHAAFLQDRAHRENVVDAAFEAVCFFRIIVDADQQRFLRLALTRWCAARQYCRHRTDRLGTRRVADDRPPDILDRRAMAKIAFRRMIGEAFVVEGRIRLAEIHRFPQADFRCEDIVLPIVEVMPEFDVERLNAAVGEIADHEGISNLRAQRHVSRIFENAADLDLPGILVAEGIVGDHRAEAVREDDIGLICAHGIQNSLPAFALEILVLDPGNDIASGPLDPVGDVGEDAAFATTDRGDSARRELPEGFGAFPSRQLRLLEDVIIGDVSAIEGKAFYGREALCERLAPLCLPV